MVLFVNSTALPVHARRALTGARFRWVCTATHPSTGTGTATATAQRALRARERRRETSIARTAAHLELKKAIDARRAQSDSEHLCTVYLSVPPKVRQRCMLPAKLGRVKTVLPRHQVTDYRALYQAVTGVLTDLYPELSTNGLISKPDDFQLKGGAGRPLPNPENLNDIVFLQVIPHNLPPKPQPRSSRWSDTRARADATLDDSGSLLRMVSFYRFFNVEDPAATTEKLKKIWGHIRALGRVYVASEGINAQMAIPEVVWPDFVDMMNGEWTERGRALVPEQILGVYLNEDGCVPRSEQPFHALHVRARHQVLADGFDKPLDWKRAGRELKPSEWHGLLDEKDAIVVDCRNKYETDLGRFQGAETPDTDTFRDTWNWLENRLDGLDKNTPVMTYCTGGIRCVKVNAFLEQKMGFTNTSRLAGGIVSYAREIENRKELGASKFAGVNHVFDGRVGKNITDDVMTTCISCGVACDIQTDCAYIGCHRSFAERLFVQCPDCAARLKGTCSEKCHQAITSTKQKSTNDSRNVFEQRMDADARYAEAHTEAEPELLTQLRCVTNQRFPCRTHMLSSPMQCSFLAMLVKLTGARRVLELGTFVGCSALHMANALPDNGELITCDVDEEVARLAKEYFDLFTADSMRPNSPRIEMYLRPACEVLQQVTGQFDLVFVDANKGAYRDYYDTILENQLVRPGGVMLWDNTLFKGLVAEHWDSDDNDEQSEQSQQSSLQDSARVEHSLIRNRVRSLRKARKIANKLHDFNQYVNTDSRTEHVLLPVRDGLTVCRVKL